MKKNITIYTDGACSQNPGPGGWGAVLMYENHQKEIFGGVANTTNNRMELTAVIQALHALKESCMVDIYTDSTYVKNGIEVWIINWRARNWSNTNNKPVKNKDLWETLDLLQKKHTIAWHFVKGHSGDRFNERADYLAKKGISKGHK